MSSDDPVPPMQPGTTPGARPGSVLPAPLERLVGRYRGREPGPTVIVVAGIHGNEPAGIHAARRVLEVLETRRTPARGQFVAFAGNTRALDLGVRYVEDDLNRIWGVERIQKNQDTPRPEFLGPEEQEQLELLARLNETLGEATGPVFLLDLHTTSGEGPPFATVGDTLRNRQFAFGFPVTVILGLEEQIDGPLLEYMSERGVVTLGLEGGQHAAATSVDNHEAAIWIALAAAGVIEPGDAPDLSGSRRLLREARGSSPRILEVRYRHPIVPDDRFVMRPGFRNFHPVSRGEPLARDARREIVAHEDGLLLMPLYQGLGEDGFFLGRAVAPFWLRISALLRRLRIDRLMPLLPGVWRHPELENTLIVNTRVARFFPLQIFHLLGYRKRRRLGPVLLVSRRRFDTASPGKGWGGPAG